MRTGAKESSSARRRIVLRAGGQLLLALAAVLSSACEPYNSQPNARSPKEESSLDRSSSKANDANHDHDSLVGRVAPPFVALDAASGRMLDSVRDRGEVTIVFFWAPWCGGCEKPLIRLDGLQRKYAASNVVVMGVAEDSRAFDVKSACTVAGVVVPFVLDGDKSIAGRWHVDTLPSVFILDGHSTIRFAHAGFRDGDDVEFEREVGRLLAMR